jgi:alpha-tubulin suppressor-like RCC1 family protein
VQGFNGYCRLGLGDQKDRLAPVAVGQFAKANVALRAQTVSCGPANTTVVDRMGIYYIAGRWKTTGDGGGGSPYTTYKYLQEMGSCKVFKTASGGAGHFALAEDHADKSLTLAIAFGQGTLHSELGLGEGLPKASTKPIKIEPLDGLALIDVAAGQGTTLFLCRPSDAYAELPRHEQLETADECFVCQQADDQPGLVCDVRPDDPATASARFRHFS